jgi:hypothetical protein
MDAFPLSFVTFRRVVVGSERHRKLSTDQPR